MLKNRTSEDGRCLNEVETSVLVLSELDIGKLKLDTGRLKLDVRYQIYRLHLVRDFFF